MHFYRWGHTSATLSSLLSPLSSFAFPPALPSRLSPPLRARSSPPLSSSHRLLPRFVSVLPSHSAELLRSTAASLAVGAQAWAEAVCGSCDYVHLEAKEPGRALPPPFPRNVPLLAGLRDRAQSLKPRRLDLAAKAREWNKARLARRRTEPWLMGTRALDDIPKDSLAVVSPEGRLRSRLAVVIPQEHELGYLAPPYQESTASDGQPPLDVRA